MSNSRQLRKAAGAVALVALGALLLTGCTDTSDQSAVNWKRIESKPIVALDGTQSVYLRGSFLSVDGGSRVDYRYAEETRDGAIREGLISTLINDPDQSSSYRESYTVDVYEDATPKTARIDIYDCVEKFDKDGKREGKDHGIIGNFFTTNGCTDGEKQVDLLVDLHVPKGTVQKDFGDGNSSAPTPTSTESSSER